MRGKPLPVRVRPVDVLLQKVAVADLDYRWSHADLSEPHDDVRHVDPLHDERPVISPCDSGRAHAAQRIGDLPITLGKNSADEFDA